MTESLVAFKIIKLERVISRWFNYKISRSGVTIHQLLLLLVLSDRRSGVNFSDMAEILGMHRSTVSRNTDSLIPLVEKNIDRVDKRNTIIKITNLGMGIVNEFRSLVEELDSEIQEHAKGVDGFYRKIIAKIDVLPKK